MPSYLSAYRYGYGDAEIVDKAKPEPNRRRRLMLIIGGVIVAVVLVSIAIAVGVSMKSSSSGEISSNMPTTVIGDEEKPADTSKPAPPPPAPVDTRTPVCKCDAGVFYNGSCYNLTDAVNAASPGGILYLSNAITVTGETIVNKSISFVGTRECGNITPTVNVTMPNNTDVGVFRVKGDQTSLMLKGILFRKIGKTLGSVVRSVDLPNDAVLGDGDSKYKPTKETINLRIENCEFRDFLTHWRGGSVIYIERVGKVDIIKSNFTNNAVDNKKILYDGTGAIYFRTIPTSSVVTIRDCVFARNKHLFFHGLGAAFGATYLNGKMMATNNQFVENVSRGGGAVYVEYVQQSSYLQLGGEFMYNTVIDVGAGSRGGAVWLKNIYGKVDITGAFVENTSPTDRGAAIANNELSKGGVVTIDADFEKNKAGKGASIWDTFYDFSDSSLTFKRGTKASNNWSDLKLDVAVRLVRPKLGAQTITIGNHTVGLMDGNIVSYDGFKVHNKTIDMPTNVNGSTVIAPVKFKAPALPSYMQDVEVTEAELNDGNVVLS